MFFLLCVLVSLFEVLWNLFIFRASACVCVCFTTNKNNFKRNCSFEPIFHSLHLKLRHSHSQRSQTHKSSIELEHLSSFSLALSRLEGKKWKLVTFERMNENERDEFYDKSFSPCFASHVAALSTSGNWRDQEGDWWKKKICSMFAFMTHFFLINSQ